jgi:HEAT repeat protein
VARLREPACIVSWRSFAVPLLSAFVDVGESGSPTSILEVEIKGVASALGNLTERGAVNPVVKANASLSESGFVSIRDAIAFGEIKDESIAGRSIPFHFERRVRWG